MATEKTPASRDAVEHEDQSIKVRKSQLFEAPEAAAAPGASRPFGDYVKDTPPAPMPPGWKAALWGVGVVVALLFLASLLTGRAPRVRPRAPRPTARTSAAPAPAPLPPGPGGRAAIG